MMKDKLHCLFFLISGSAFLSFFIFALFLSKSDAASWWAFSVLMPVCGISLLLGAVLYIAGFHKKKSGSEQEASADDNSKAFGGYLWIAVPIAVVIVILTILNCVQ